jgi:internalin A
MRKASSAVAVAIVLFLDGMSWADEASAIAALEKVGARIRRDVTLPGKPAVKVILSEEPVKDTDLAAIASLEHLQTLHLDRTHVTDAGLKHLAGLKQLRDLYLYRLPGVTDAGMKDVVSLTQLRVLRLGVTSVTDAGLKDIGSLTQLQSLGLGTTKVTDVGLKELASLKQLVWLRLDKTAVTDEGLKDLAAITSLQTLDLSGTRVTDAGLKDLATLKQLQELNLTGTKATETGVNALQAALPNCNIILGKADAQRLPQSPEPSRMPFITGLLASGLVGGAVAVAVLWYLVGRRTMRARTPGRDTGPKP